MRIYVWDNDNEELEFNTHNAFDLVDEYTSGYHSGGWVVMAESKEKAVEHIMKSQGWSKKEVKEYLMRTASEFVEKEGIIYFGDGDC